MTNLSVPVNNEKTDIIRFEEKKTKKPYQFERPGPLVNQVQLVLNTVDAQTLFLGHFAKSGISLIQFGGKTAELWAAAEKDDPYADWYLVKIYDAVITLRNQLITTIQAYQEQLNKVCSCAGFIIKPFQSEKPVIKSLWFKTQYGYLAAQIIAQFDELMRTILTAKRIGVILEKPYETVRNEFAQQITVLFKMPFKWQQFNITRADIEANNETAQTAKKVLSELPESILTKKLRSPFAPNIQLKKSGFPAP